MMKVPTFMSVISRKLKENCTYDDFYQAWLPLDLNGKNPKQEAVGYYHGPVQIINAVNANDPNDILTVCLIWGSQEEIMKDVERTKATDDQRHKSQIRVVDKGQDTKFYCVKDVNLLGTPIPN